MEGSRDSRRGRGHFGRVEGFPETSRSFWISPRRLREHGKFSYDLTSVLLTRRFLSWREDFGASETGGTTTTETLRARRCLRDLCVSVVRFQAHEEQPWLRPCRAVLLTRRFLSWRKDFGASETRETTTTETLRARRCLRELCVSVVRFSGARRAALVTAMPRCDLGASVVIVPPTLHIESARLGARHPARWLGGILPPEATRCTGAARCRRASHQDGGAPKVGT